MEYIKNQKFIILLIILVLFTLLTCKYRIKNIKYYYTFPLYPEIFKDFFSKNEIKKILDSCSQFNKSTIVKDGKLVYSNYRTSSSCFINEYSDISKFLRNKIKKTFNLENDIELQLTHYNTGEYYDYHYDYFSANNLENKRQRLKTIFVYLECPNKGGETEFPLLNKKFNPNVGDAIMWTNCFKSNKGYDYIKHSFHGGMKVTKGKKIGLNIWILDKNS